MFRKSILFSAVHQLLPLAAYALNPDEIPTILRQTKLIEVSPSTIARELTLEEAPFSFRLKNLSSKDEKVYISFEEADILKTRGGPSSGPRPDFPREHVKEKEQETVRSIVAATKEMIKKFGKGHLLVHIRDAPKNRRRLASNDLKQLLLASLRSAVDNKPDVPLARSLQDRGEKKSKVMDDDVSVYNNTNIVTVRFDENTSDEDIYRAASALVELSPIISRVESDAVVSIDPIVEENVTDEVRYTPRNRTESKTRRLDEKMLIKTNNDPKHQYIIDSMNLREAWAVTTGDPEMKVMVIDDGVNVNHKDMKENIWNNEPELRGENNVDDDGNGVVDDVNGYNPVDNSGVVGDIGHGHGQHIAGIIGAVGNNNEGVAGVAWNVKVIQCDCIDDGDGSVSDIIRCIDYAIEKGVKIVNASFGNYQYNDSLKAAVERLYDNNILLVGAAGNDGHDSDVKPMYPASYIDVPNVISVAAIDKNDDKWKDSNYGLHSVHLGAPGAMIINTLREDYGWFSGTSMATPHVAGVGALIWAANPNLRVEEVRSLIQHSVTPIESLEETTIWGGKINAGLAVQRAKDPHWLVPTNRSWHALGELGVVAKGNSDTLIHLTTTPTFRGHNAGRITIRSENDEILGTVDVNISFRVPPKLGSVESRVMIPYMKFDSTTRTLSLENVGMEPLQVEIREPKSQKIAVDKLKLEIAPESSESITISCNGPEIYPTDELSERLKITAYEGLELTPKVYSLLVSCTIFWMDFTVGRETLVDIGKSVNPVGDPPYALKLRDDFKLNGVTYNLDVITYVNVLPRYLLHKPPTEYKILDAIPSAFRDEPQTSIQFVDISALDGVIHLEELDKKDDGTATYELEQFKVPLFGKFHDTIYINTNGFFACEDFSGNGHTAELDAIRYGVAPFWLDSLVSDDGKVHLFETENRLVVQWTGMSVYGIESLRLHYQAHVLASGDVFFAYRPNSGPTYSHLLRNPYQIGISGGSKDEVVYIANGDRYYQFSNPKYIHAIRRTKDLGGVGAGFLTGNSEIPFTMTAVSETNFSHVDKSSMALSLLDLRSPSDGQDHRVTVDVLAGTGKKKLEDTPVAATVNSQLDTRLVNSSACKVVAHEKYCRPCTQLGASWWEDGCNTANSQIATIWNECWDNVETCCANSYAIKNALNGWNEPEKARAECRRINL